MKIIEDVVGMYTDKLRCLECHIKHWHLRADGPGWRIITKRNKAAAMPCETCEQVLGAVNPFGAQQALAASKDGKLFRLCLLRDDKQVNFTVEASPGGFYSEWISSEERISLRASKLEF